MITLPPLLLLPDEASYRKYFNENFVWGIPIFTFDGIQVRFFPVMFDHAFFRAVSRSSGDKAAFARELAERMEWIRAMLQSSEVELYRRTVRGKLRRIALEPTERYAVVIQIRSKDGRMPILSLLTLSTAIALSQKCDLIPSGETSRKRNRR